jgi:ABC-2 type transport system permease protein
VTALAAAPRPAGPRAARSAARRDRWAGTAALVRVALRVERVRLPVWLLAVAGLTAVSASSEADLFPTAESRAARAELMRSPAAVALGGPGYGLDDYTIGAMVANELGSWVALALAVLSVLLVVRHLRGTEESGLLEVVRSTPVGRDAPVLAAVVVVTLADLAIGVALAGALAATGLPVAGAVAFGLGCGLVGLAFGAVAAVAAQVATHARTASMLGLAAVGVGFVLRAAGDVRAPESGSVLSWLSPFGWSQATRAWVDERWWPLVLPVLAAAAGFGAAALLAERRDLGTGLLPARPGRAAASARLTGIAAVTLRRLAGALGGWTAGVVAICALVGVLAREVVQFIEDEPALAAFFPQGSGAAAEAALARYLLVAVALAAAAAVQGVAAVRAEEVAGRAAHVLAGPLGRARWLTAQLGVVLGGTAAMVVLGGLVMGATAARTLDEPDLVGRLVAASVAQLPALAVVAGVAVLVLGAAPRAFGLAWAFLGYVVLTAMLGGVLPDGSDVASPLRYTPMLPAEPMDWPAVLVLAALGAVLLTAGVLAFRRRDPVA